MENWKNIKIIEILFDDCSETFHLFGKRGVLFLCKKKGRNSFLQRNLKCKIKKKYEKKIESTKSCSKSFNLTKYNYVITLYRGIGNQFSKFPAIVWGNALRHDGWGQRFAYCEFDNRAISLFLTSCLQWLFYKCKKSSPNYYSCLTQRTAFLMVLLRLSAILEPFLVIGLSFCTPFVFLGLLTLRQVHPSCSWSVGLWLLIHSWHLYILIFRYYNWLRRILRIFHEFFPNFN